MYIPNNFKNNYPLTFLFHIYFIKKKLDRLIKINKIILICKLIFLTHLTNLKSSPDALDTGGGLFTGFLFCLLSSYD